MAQAPADVSARTARNALYSVASLAYPTMLTVVVTPVILHFIGNARYAIFALTGVVVSFLGVLDFGMAPALVKFVASSRAIGDVPALSVHAAAARRFYSVIGLGGIVCAAVLAAVARASWFGVAPDDAGLLRFSLVLAGIAFYFTMLTNAYSGVLEGLQWFDVSAQLRLLVITLGAGLSIIAVASFDLRGLMVATVVQAVVGLAGFRWAVHRRVIGFSPRATVRRRDLRTMFGFSSYTFAVSVAGVALLQLDKFFLAATASAVAVTYYVVPGLVAQRLHTAAARLSSVLLPLVADLHAHDDAYRIERLYERATRLVLISVAAVATPLVVFAPALLRFWVGADFERHSSAAMRLLVCTYALLAFTAVPYYLCLGYARPRLGALFTGATALLDVGLMVVLIPRYGVVGAAAAYLASMAVVPLWIWYVERRLLLLERSPWAKLGPRVAVAVALQAAICVAARPLAANLLYVLLLLLATAPIGLALAMPLRLIDAHDRALARRLLVRRPVGS